MTIKAIIPVAYTATQADIDAGLANNLPKGTAIIVIDSSQQPTDIKVAQGGGTPPADSSGIKNNFASTTVPTVTNDSSQGYNVGSRWIDTVGDESYICLDATVGGAVWSKSTVGTISEVSGLQASLDTKAPLASPTFTGTVGGITKGMVGLGSVDNTADTAKPVSTIQQTALDGKRELYSLGHPYATGATTYGHTITTSSQFNSDYAGWKAFQQNPSSGNEWATLGSVAASLMIELPSPVIFTRCALRGRVSGGEYATRWKLEGSNDGSTFTTLLDKTVADESLQYSLGEKVFDFTNTVPYKFYRFNFTSWVGNNVGLNSIRWSHQGINILPTAINTLTSTSTTEALSAAQGKILQDGKQELYEGTVALRTPNNLTSNTSDPNYILTASSEHTTNLFYRAFDGNDANHWYTLGTSVANGVIELRYKTRPTNLLLRGETTILEYWTRWQLQGSNNGTTWDTLVDKSGVDEFIQNTSKNFPITTTKEYKYFRFNGLNAVGTNIPLSRLEISGVEAERNFIDWTSFTPGITSESGTWSNYTATGKYRIIDKMLTVTFRVIFSNTPTAADALYISLPSGMTMNTTVMTGGGGWDTDQVGVAILGDSGTVSGVPAIITTRTNQKVLVKYYNAAASSYLTCPGLSNTAPWTWTTNDTVDGQFTVPIQ